MLLRDERAVRGVPSRPSDDLSEELDDEDDRPDRHDAGILGVDVRRRDLRPVGAGEVKAPPLPFPERFVYPARIVSVHDGDTVRAELDLGFEIRATWSLRLLGVQAPEVGGPNVSDAEKVAGKAARDALAGLIVNPVGQLFVRSAKDKAEGRGRYLATLLLVQEGQTFDVNALLIAEGYATAAPLDGSKVPKWTPNGWVKG